MWRTNKKGESYIKQYKINLSCPDIYTLLKPAFGAQFYRVTNCEVDILKTLDQKVQKWSKFILECRKSGPEK